MSQDTRSNRVQSLLSGAGVIAVWGLVAFANYYTWQSTPEEPVVAVSPLQLSRSFQTAAAQMQGRIVEFVAVAGDSLTETNLTTLGAGILIDQSGTVLTTTHVAQHAGDLRIRLNNGELVAFGELQTKPESQLATVKLLSSQKFPVAEIGDALQLQAGDWVVAVSPDGSSGPIVKPGTVHQIQASDKLNPVDRLLLTDAAANPGLEGTPIVDLTGAVVGLVCNQVEIPEGNDHVGSAVAVQHGTPWLAAQLTSATSHCESRLGVAVESVTPEMAARCKLGSNQGAQITRVIPNTPGTEAGLQIGDVVVALGEHRITSPDELHVALQQLTPGLRKPVEIVRDGWRITTHVSVPAASFE